MIVPIRRGIRVRSQRVDPQASGDSEAAGGRTSGWERNMNRNLVVLSILGLAVGIVGLSLVLTGIAAPDAAAAGAPAKKAPPVHYSVLKVGTEYHAVKKTEVETFKKKLETDYKEKVKAYEEAKKAALKKKQKFTEPKPVLYKAVVLSTFQSEKLAQEDIEKRKAADEKKKAAQKKTG